MVHPLGDCCGCANARSLQSVHVLLSWAPLPTVVIEPISGPALQILFLVLIIRCHTHLVRTIVIRGPEGPSGKVLAGAEGQHCCDTAAHKRAKLSYAIVNCTCQLREEPPVSCLSLQGPGAHIMSRTDGWEQHADLSLRLETGSAVMNFVTVVMMPKHG